ncbi:flavodoxin family protein [Nitratireductor rhodophyticola]|uniref:flavodoxin family protein n=1 Tax=Nitratireductor rhodophyticola TaxID=2854036 RepID=UPI003BABD98E
MPLNDLQKRLADDANSDDFPDLKALFINTTLKPSGRAASHTEDLMRGFNRPHGALWRCGPTIFAPPISTLPSASSPDMREEGAAADDWPEKIWPKVNQADILVIGTPIWLGEESSICRVIIERLYAHSGQRNAKVPVYLLWQRLAGTIITGNEDGIKHVAKTVLYSLQHIGYTDPASGRLRLDRRSRPRSLPMAMKPKTANRAGYDSAFTRRNLTFMTFNLMHMARMLRDAGGLPDHGNQTTDWA